MVACLVHVCRQWLQFGSATARDALGVRRMEGREANRLRRWIRGSRRGTRSPALGHGRFKSERRKQFLFCLVVQCRGELNLRGVHGLFAIGGAHPVWPPRRLPQLLPTPPAVPYLSRCDSRRDPLHALKGNATRTCFYSYNSTRELSRAIIWLISEIRLFRRIVL